MATLIKDAVVKARIDKGIKAKAIAALDAMGLSVSDVINMVLIRVAEEGKLPFDVRVPSARLKQALSDVRNGKVETFSSTADALTHLGLSENGEKTPRHP